MKKLFAPPLIIIMLFSITSLTLSCKKKSINLSAVLKTPNIGDFTIPTHIVNDGSFDLSSPTSDSKGAFSYISSNVAVATISGTKVNILAVGTTTITATQAADGNFSSGSKTAALNVTAIPPGLVAPSITGFTVAPVTKTVGTKFNLVAPTSNSAGSFAYLSSDQSVATITGTQVTITGVGTTTITALQAANGNYTAGSVTADLVIAIGTPTITNFTIAAHKYGDVPFTLSDPSSNSNGAFTYTSSDPTVASISATNKVTILKVGTSTIKATQAATANFTTGFVTANLVITVGTPTITNFIVASHNLGDASFFLSDPQSNSSGPFTFTSSNSAVASVTGYTVTIKGLGTTTIKATQGATGSFTTGSISANLIIKIVEGTAYAGGTVFYVDNTGTHGLIAAPVDAPNIGEVKWASINFPTGAVSLTDGSFNTNKLVALYGQAAYAASTCKYYTGGGFTDWFLPSKNQLETLFSKQNLIGGLPPNLFYWSSTEDSNDYNSAWILGSNNGSLSYTVPKTGTAKARPIRAF